MAKEKDDIKILCGIITDEVLQKRLRGSMEWYMKNAVKNKRRFYILSFMTIVMPLLTTLFNAWMGISEAYAKNIVSLCSMLAALAASALCLLKCQEKWILYRTTVEKMKKMLSMYRAVQLGEDELIKLMRALEDCMDNERVKWQDLRENPRDNTNSDESTDNQ